MVVDQNSARQGIVVCNLDASIVVSFGAKNVTATNGIKLAGGASSPFIPTKDAVYAVGASGNPQVAVLEIT